MGDPRFIGMTKFQWIGLLAVLVLAGFVAQAYTLRVVTDQAAEGRQAHVAFCSYKHDLAQRAEDSHEFLALTREQRIAKYGEALGAIPAATIRQSYHNQVATLESLDALKCP